MSLSRQAPFISEGLTSCHSTPSSLIALRATQSARAVGVLPFRFTHLAPAVNSMPMPAAAIARAKTTCTPSISACMILFWIALAARTPMKFEEGKAPADTNKEYRDRDQRRHHTSVLGDNFSDCGD